MRANGFFIGRIFDTATGKPTGPAIHYNPADLTTHAVVTGMTGSGKTGLCIALLEEAALQGIPAIIIDPKGDLTNLVLHFPDLASQDFQPWIDPDMARRAGRTLEQAAAEASLAWRNGLAAWDIPQERLLALKNAAEFSIYTPGSDAGRSVSVLSSLAAPDLPWEGNREVLRERISSTVTALLGLVGYKELDPVRSREHILLANIFESAWSKGDDLELTTLIDKIQSPPFEKLGAFQVDTFFPSKERRELALVLNNILAAPAFEAWREGQPLDPQALLFTTTGRPRHSIFYLAHLSDAERMFFVTLLFSALETWMRTQTGATSLRALLYMDELYGYMPPTQNPPSKQPLLRMLKQARAFGLGLLLATQNPVDLDYKALSNAGTWFIGKLQTERDKLRLLDGLESASPGVSRATLDRSISALGKRVFVLHNVHAAAPTVFQSRWTMNFLAGPLTRTHIPALNRLAHAAPAPAGADLGRTQPTAAVGVPTAKPSPSAARRPSSVAPSGVKPSLPVGVREYTLPQSLSLPEAFAAAKRPGSVDAAVQNLIYRPTLLASAQVRLLDRKVGVDTEVRRAILVRSPDRRGVVQWDDFIYEGPPLDNVETAPPPGGRFGALDSPFTEARIMTAIQKDFTDWVFRNTSLQARANPALKVYAGPDVSQADFMKACADAARTARDAELAKKTTQIDRQIKTLENKLAREERELRQDESDLQHRKWEEMGTHAENVLGVLGGRRSSRRLSTSLTKRRLTEDAKADVEESRDSITQYNQQLSDLRAQREHLIAEISDRWGNMVNDIREVTIKPKRTDVFVNQFGIAWLPHYVVQAGAETFELPAFA